MLTENILVFGGDKRSIFASEYFLSSQYNTEIFVSDRPDGYKEAVGRADVIFLGLPAVMGGYVNMPLSDKKTDFEELLSLCKPNAVIAGGRLKDDEIKRIEGKGLRWIDYSTDEIFQLENALYTAEGTVAKLIENTQSSLMGMKILITGSGRISRMLCSILSSVPCDICVYARNSVKRTDFELKGIKTRDSIGELSCFDVVINTVPADILTYDVLKTAKQEALIVDLSARPGYVNKDICRQLGIELMYLPGIPLLSAPRSAGISAAGATERMLREGENS